MVAGGRGAIATTTPGLDFQSICTPEGVQERPVITTDVRSLCDRCSGVEYICGAKPRVVVAIAPRPGANFFDPSGIKNNATKSNP